MASQSQHTEIEELTWLRARVAELEKSSSERARATAALQESRRLFDSFLCNTPAVAWMKDELGRYVFANRRFHDLVSESGATCLGSTDFELWAPSVAERMRAGDMAVTNGSAVVDSVETLPFRDGEKQFRIHRFPFHSTGGRLYVGSIGIDITGEELARAQASSFLETLRRVEERSERLFHSALIGVMECSGDIVTDANEALLGWLGYSRDDLAQPLNWRTLTPPRFRQRDDEALAELRATGSWQPFEKELFDHAGKPMPVIVGASETGTGHESFICFVLNISERKQMESRLLRSQKLESLGLIAGGVAHDFNNLLATIMGNAGLAVDALPSDHPAFYSLNEVIVASRRASDLTQQVLAYSGRAHVPIKALDLSRAVREIGSLLETTISKKIDLKFELAEGLPPIDAEEGQLQQIIMNLVINASDAIGEQKGRIEVKTFPQGAGVCFEVRDSGCGMDESTKARIFDPFFTTKSHGRGLGLAAVLGIVRNHEAAMHVESQPGAGTTFRVTFPAGKAAAAPPPCRSAPSDIKGTETILVADDDEGIRRMTKMALERLGYTVLLASNGQEAVDVFLAHRDRIAVVLIDWAMPVMNGEEALMRIFEAEPSARVIMSSGYAETETLQRVATPLAGFVQKPYTTHALARRLRDVIDGAPHLL